MDKNLNNGEKELFSIKGEFNIKQFSDYLNVSKKLIFLDYISYLTLFLLLVLTINTFQRGTIIDLIVKYSIVAIVFILFKLCRIKREKNLRYNSVEKRIKDKEYTIEFYNNYFIKKGDYIVMKVDYGEIKKVVETNNYFHIEFKSTNVSFKKSGLNEDQIQFIRDIRKGIYYNKIKN